MSSTYRPICLSHSPALVLDIELTYDEARALDNRTRISDHQHCDIIIGRWSGALVELACIGRQLPGPTGCKGYHRSIDWTDRDWLRLLLAAAPCIDADLLRPLITRCWPLERLERLRVELDLPAPAPIAPAAGRRFEGEHGPELLQLPHGSTVHPLTTTKD